MTNHPNRAPFPYRVQLSSYAKPHAGFLTEERAKEYAAWLSGMFKHQYISVNHNGETLAQYLRGQIYDNARS